MTQTMTSPRLRLTNFSLPFNTQGVDIYSSPADPETIFIFAVNHLPNYTNLGGSNLSILEARSQIVLFKRKLGSHEAQHLRSIQHPLIRTPNDIYARSAHKIFVTNDHYYREGIMRLAENIAYINTSL
jgi:hypothetical protein